jgi:hypothetical protein
MHMIRTCLVLSSLALFSWPSFAQQSDGPCAPPVFKIYKEKNMFNEQQEIWLGEILDEQFAKAFDLIEDPEGDYLQNLGERILAQLPPTSTKYRFYIMDAPQNTAFSVGGSRIYVSRQLIAFLKNEDELAGLLAHEIGHIFTHQKAIDVTRIFRKALDVKQVGDRKDIFEKWNQLRDIYLKKSIPFDFEREEEEQQIADRLALHAMIRAGYQPLQFADFFDRLAENKGKKGNIFSDIFGTTNPNSKRVRLLINNSRPMPQQCIATTPIGPMEHFLAWQKGVIGAKRLVAKAQIPGILKQVTLGPPLRGNLEYLQFSPDGNYILVQDESSVFVLSHHPLANLFRFDALKPHTFAPIPYWPGGPLDRSTLTDQHVQFTPDSRSIVFYDSEMRVEKWDIESQQRTSVHEVVLSAPCMRVSLSSTGEVMACVRREKDDYRLLLMDVATNAVFLNKKILPPFLPDFYDFAGLPYHFFSLLASDWFTMGFSPDSRYFVLGSNKQMLAYDLQARAPMKTTHGLQHYTSSRFIFTTPERIVALDPGQANQVVLLHFPSGEVQDKFPLNINGQPLVNVRGMEGKFIAPGRGAYLLVSPAGRWPMALFDLEAKKFLLGYKTPGLAIHTNTLAAEGLGGRISLFGLDQQLQATVQLPLSPLPDVAAAEFSQDGKWLAVAGQTSGGIWNVDTGERSLDIGTFTGGFFDHGQLVAVSHRLEQQPKVVRLDPLSKKQEDLYTIDPLDTKKKEKEVDQYAWQAGNLLLRVVELKKDEFPSIPGLPNLCLGCKLRVEARDIRTNQISWTHQFAEFIPVFFYSQTAKTLTLLFESHYSVKKESKNDPKLKERFDHMRDKEAVNMVEVLDPETGEIRGNLLYDTGNSSITPIAAVSAGDTVLVYDRQNRTLVYSLKSGLQKGHVLGRFQAISAEGDRMLVENAKGECALYDMATLQMLAQYTFPNRLIRAELVSDGTLLVLTADQTIYRLNVPTNSQTVAQQ